MLSKREIFKDLPFKYDEKIIIAISSGKDSTCLYYLFKEKFKNIILVHINHNLRKESKQEEEYLINLAKKNNHKIYVAHFKYENNKNFHSEAREFRYNFFKEIAKKERVKYILTAHHLNDQAETIIERLIKGSSIYGYSGINKIVIKEDVIYYRPLITTKVKDIEEYIKQNNIKYFEDSSNTTDSYFRNRIRHNIIGKMEEENINFLDKINEFHNILLEAHEYIRKKTEELYKEKIEIEEYKNLDKAIQKDLILYILENNNINKNYNQIDLINKFLLNDKNDVYFYINKNLYIYKDSKYFYTTNKIKEIKKEDKEILIEELNKAYKFLNYKIIVKKNSNLKDEKNNLLCYNHIKLPFTARTKRDGDRLVYNYGSKNLTKLLREKKIDKYKKETILVITDNLNNIIYVDKLYKNSDLEFIVEEIYD